MKKLKVYYLILALCFVIGTMRETKADRVKKHVLSFGGNGNIGSAVLKHLWNDDEVEYSVTLVSRGNWYFDAETEIKPKLTQAIICDREDSDDLEYCPELLDYIKSMNHIDVVLDFSAYRPEAMEPALKVLQGKVGVYVFISSDSVYEVSQAAKTPGRADEEDAIRPESVDEQDELNLADSYGHEKLACEELLRGESNTIPYLIFRLPDVLGPRDTTERIWTYVMWLQFYKFFEVPIHIPAENEYLKTSYVYVYDVARAIKLALNKGPEFWNQVYNLGFEEEINLEQLLKSLQAELGVEVEYDMEGEFSLFPSVTRGSVIIDKVKSKLGFQPTPWKQAMQEIVAFYKTAFYKFISERDDISHQLTRNIIPSKLKGDFLMMIDKLTLNPEMTLDQYIAEKKAHEEL